MTKIYLQTVTGTFHNADSSDDAQAYLLANGFEETEVIVKSDNNNSLLSVFAISSIEAREAADVLRNYGAVDICVG